MFKSLLSVLQTILVQFSETNYMRLVTAFAVIVPLVLAMYIAYMGVAKFDVAISTIFFYITTAVVWSFTTDLQPALVGGKKK